jgi:hypothetical protein
MNRELLNGYTGFRLFLNCVVAGLSSSPFYLTMLLRCNCTIFLIEKRKLIYMNFSIYVSSEGGSLKFK